MKYIFEILQIIAFIILGYFYTWQLSILLYIIIFLNNIQNKTHVQRISKKYPRR
jgi:hypothetical protein